MRKINLIKYFIVFVLLWIVIGFSHYVFLYKENMYDCSDMSDNQQKIMQSLGLKVNKYEGYKIKDNWEFMGNYTQSELEQLKKFGSNIIRVLNNSCYYNNCTTTHHHVWLSIDLGLFEIPWESRFLLPINPDWFMDYDKIERIE